ncbi:MAG: hypothetical protein ABI241_07125 [Bacteroidia bacterium]
MLRLIIISSTNALGLNSTQADTLKGYFIFYSASYKNLDHYKTYEVIMPLNAKGLKQAIDSFNIIVSNISNYNNFLNGTKKIHEMDYIPMEYLIKKYSIDSAQAQKIYSGIFFKRLKSEGQIVKYSIEHKNVKTLMFLFKAEMFVAEDINNKDCSSGHFKTEDDIICYPINFDEKCRKNVLMSIK